jgi:hypothetical protein
MEALLYRVLEPPNRPSTIVITVAAPLFNRGYRCSGCLRVPLAPDLLQISKPFDANFMLRALSLDPEDRAQLLLGGFLPAVAAGPHVSAAARCDLTEAGRSLARQTGRAGPTFLTAANPCELANPSDGDHMSVYWRAAHEQMYRDDLLRNYSFTSEQSGHVRNMVAMARAKGAAVSFVQFPNYFLERVNPEADRIFQSRISSITGELGVPMFDYSTQLRNDPSLWGDPLHLNARGAVALAPMLADALKQVKQ